MFESNELLQKLPKHLLNLIIDQPYNDYTPQDHAVWRYVMRQNVHYLSKVAHGSYINGLKRTGISIDRIPHMYGMNRILKEIGWAAVAVDGFIPPAAFMEFQAYNILVIAADIRPINQIEYTPAPDIIHEAAGHAPIIADPEYAEYLRLFGHYGSKAFSSPRDQEIYSAIRHLSILKADPNSRKQAIQKAEEKLMVFEQNGDELSELAKIRNLHWWTVEYGLIGTLTKPKLYGAGLLSSIGESYHALSDQVKKLPYTIAAADYCFDITNMQPHLFVTPDFAHLTKTLYKYVEQMGLSNGGLCALKKAVNSEQVACTEYDTGLQVSGVLSRYIQADEKLIYINTEGPTNLTYLNKELKGHDVGVHADGFGSPVGRIKGIESKFELMTDDELEKHGFLINQDAEFEYESGIKVSGRLKRILREDCKILLLSFDNCTVTYKGETLFEPGWGVYDMAVGKYIRSCSRGPADPASYGYEYPVPDEKTHKINYSSATKKLHSFYQKASDLRTEKSSLEKLIELQKSAFSKYPKEWLLHLEILELLSTSSDIDLKTFNLSYDHLMHLAKADKSLGKLIQDGLERIDKPLLSQDAK